MGRGDAMDRTQESTEELERRCREAEANATRLAETQAHETHIKRVLEAIRNVDRLIVTEDNPNRLIKKACANLTETMGYSNAWIALLDDQGEHVTATAASGFEVGFEALRGRLEKGEFPSCMRETLGHDRVVVVDDAELMCKDCPVSQEHAGRTDLCHALRANGRTLGHLAVSVPKTYAHDDEEQDLFEELAGDLALALLRIQRNQSLYRASEIMSRSLAVAFVWRNTEGWPVEFASPNVIQLFGWTAEEFVSGAVSYADVVYPNDLGRVVSEVARFSSDREVDYFEHAPYRIICRDGRCRWVRDMTYVRRDDRRDVLSFEGILVDISEHKRAEEALRKEQELSHRIIDDGPLAITILDRNGTILSANRRAEQILGLTVSEIAGRAYNDPDWRITSSTGGAYPDAHLPFRLVMETTRPVRDIKHAIQWPDGMRRILNVCAAPLTDEMGQIERIVCSIEDITEQKQADLELQAAKAFSDAVLENSPFAMWVSDADGIVLRTNRSLLETLNLREEQIVGNYCVLNDENLKKCGVMPQIRAVFQECKATRFSLPWKVADAGSVDFSGGRDLFIDVAMFPILNPAGELAYVVCQWVDVTERRLAQEALQESGAQWHSYVENAPYGIFVGDRSGRCVEVNPACVRITGYSRTELLTMSFPDLLPPENVQSGLAYFQRLVQQGTFGGELRYRHKNGQIRWWTVSAVALSRERFLAFVDDITERKRAETELQDNDEYLRTILETTADGFFAADDQGRLMDANEAYCRMSGYSRDELLHMYITDLDADENPTETVERIREIAKRGTAFFETRHRRKDGTIFSIENSVTYVGKREGSVVCFCRDITERKQAEKALQENEKRLSSLYDSMIEGLCLHELVYDDSGQPVNYRILDVNPQYETILGKQAVEVKGRLATEVYGTEEAPCIETFGRVAETGQPERFETYFENMDKHFSIGVFSPEKGQFATVFQDVTERKHAEEERRKLREQLMQMQKMESVGRLAGGVAHDFNNMLSVILGQTDLLLGDLPDDGPMRVGLEEIRRSGQRSAELVRQLLGFARRQTVTPKALDLNNTVTAMLKMLRRLIGENIELRWEPSDTPKPVFIDPVQLDQLLTNLVVNARDAIEGVGRITIETACTTLDEEYCARDTDALPGQYIMLVVSDDGRGMDEETRVRAFEPFFTTKGMGQGTGLGLATVYGIVRQNRGLINIYSELGHGTTFRVYLPEHREGGIEERPVEIEEMASLQGNETILLVEDEVSILNMTRIVLERLGYQVLAATAPSEAIRLAKEYPNEINLLMTDVVMPEMNGRELARHLLPLYPKLKLLFMSGYTANVIAHHGVLDKGVYFLQKPFSNQLAGQKVREVLDS